MFTLAIFINLLPCVGTRSPGPRWAACVDCAWASGPWDSPVTRWINMLKTIVMRFTSGYLEPDRVLSAPMMETSHTMVRLSSGSHWEGEDRLLRMLVSMNFLKNCWYAGSNLYADKMQVHLKPQESGLALNCVKVDLTLFCLFLAASRIVNSYLAFTSASVWLLR